MYKAFKFIEDDKEYIYPFKSVTSVVILGDYEKLIFSTMDNIKYTLTNDGTKEGKEQMRRLIDNYEDWLQE